MRRISIVLRVLITLVFSLPLFAQGTYSGLHIFTGGVDGGHPLSGLTVDRAGNLYGTTSVGGYTGGVCGAVGGCGTVFRLSPKNGSWMFTVLYAFQGGQDGSWPQATLTIGPDGAVYGTTLYGGASGCSEGYGCGIAFRLAPQSSFCRSALCPWKETLVYDFANAPRGIATPYGGLTFDSQGNIYGAAFVGGVGICSRACGAIYKLTPNQGTYAMMPIYIFTGGEDGASPMSTLLRDANGNLYGTTSFGGDQQAQAGTVFQLVPNGQTWRFNLLYTFRGEEDGGSPISGLVMDSAGNLYGDTPFQGANGGGTVFELSPQQGGWNFTVVDSPIGGLWAPMNIDSDGNLYGTTAGGGWGNAGRVFHLTPSDHGWIEHDLHDFSGTDGAVPHSNVSIDSAGRLYGTTTLGGGNQTGVVWQIRP